MTLFPPNLAAEEALAAVGAVLRSIQASQHVTPEYLRSSSPLTTQIIPQIVKSYRTKSTHGLSSAFMLVWSCTQLALGPYTIVQQLAIPLQIQPQAFAFFSAVSWAQCLYYGKEWSRARSAMCFVALLSVLAGAQVGSVFGLRAGRAAGNETPVMVFGYLTWLRTFLSAPPQFYKIYKLREVVGTSFLFMGVDILGAIFSILSLLFRPKLDVPAIVTFALVVVQNGLVILLALILNPIARRRRAAEGLDADGEPESPTQEYLAQRRGTRATQYSTASSATMVDWSARASRVDLEKGKLEMSRTNTLAAPEEPKGAGAETRVEAVSPGSRSPDAPGSPGSPRSPRALRSPVAPMTRCDTQTAELGNDCYPSGTTTRVGSEAPTPLERSRNPTMVDLPGLARLEEKADGEDKAVQ